MTPNEGLTYFYSGGSSVDSQWKSRLDKTTHKRNNRKAAHHEGRP